MEEKNSFLKMKSECLWCQEHQLLVFENVSFADLKIGNIVQWKNWTLQIVDTFAYEDKFLARIVGVSLPQKDIWNKDHAELCYACQKSKLYSFKEAVLGRFGHPQNHQHASQHHHHDAADRSAGGKIV
jgi:hypothetical protein